MRTPSDPQGAEEALARTVLCRVFRQALVPPEAREAAAASLPARGEALERAARRLDAGGDYGLAEAIAGLIRLAPPSPARLGRERERLFGHTLRGAVCPYECEYGGRVPLQQAHDLADLAGFYRAFGLRPATRAGERADHVACEMEFFEFLSAKEAVALAGGDREMAEITRRAARKFLRCHLGRFGIAFACRLEESASEDLFRHLARACAAFLRVACASFGVEAGPELLALRPVEPDGVPMACGAEEGDGREGGGLVQIGGRQAPS